MDTVKLGMSEQEVRDELLQYYDEEIVEGMIQALKRNGTSVYGAFLVREASLIREFERPYNLFRMSGMNPPKRSDNNA